MEEQLTEIDFISPCPAQECIYKDKMYKWTHNQCGGRLKLDGEGMLRCLKCRIKEEFVDFRLNCGAHDYEDYSAQGVAHALAIMGRIAEEESRKKFVTRVSSAIMKQILEREENKNIKGSINIEKRKSDPGNNLDGEECNESPFQNVEKSLEEDNEQHINMLLEDHKTISWVCKSKILGGILGLIAMLFSFVKGDFPNALGGFLTLLGLMIIKQFRNQKELLKALLYMIIGLIVYDIIWLGIYGGSCWYKHDRGTGGNENGLLIASFFITIINEVLKGMLGFSLWAASTKA